MRRHARVFFAVAALASFFAFATTASAGYEEIGKIGGTGPNAGGSGPEDGQFFNPNQVAVNDATGDIYVADTGNNRVQVFKPNASGGEYDSQFSITGPTGMAVDQANGDLYVASASGVSKFDSSLLPKAGWSAPSASGSLAVDPSSGDLLVADRDANLIRRFGSDGTAKGTFAADAPISVAANSSGEVFVVTTTGNIYTCASSAVKRFSSAGVETGTVAAALTFPGAVSIDPDDDSIAVATNVATYNSCGGERPAIVSFDSLGTELEALTLEANTLYATVAGLAVQGEGSKRIYAVTRSPFAANDDPYGASQVIAMAYLNKPSVAIDPVAESSITRTEAQFSGLVNPNGFLTEWHFEYSADAGGSWTSTPDQSAGAGTSPVAVSASVSGLQAEANYQVRLVATNSEGTKASAERSFTTDPAVGVNTEAASNLASGSATLNGTVNPGGIALSECQFEYGTSEGFGSTVPCAESLGSIGSGEAPVPVHADVTGLSTGIYYFRLAATNSLGTTRGSTQTAAIPGPPVILGQSASSEGTKAFLKARVNPGNKATTYFFEYGPTSAYGESTPEETLAAGNDPVALLYSLEGLAPETTYHFRLVATNSIAQVMGEDRSFATDPAGSDSCPNAPVRAEQGSVVLPECRAWEQVSPRDKLTKDVFNGPEPEYNGSGLRSLVAIAADGSAAAFQSKGAFGDAEAGHVVTSYVSRRGSGGWATHAITSRGYLGGATGNTLYLAAASEDLSKVAILTDPPPPNPLAPGGTLGQANLYLADLGANAVQTLTTDPGTGPFPSVYESLIYVGASPDLSTVVFEDRAVPYTDDAPVGYASPYAWHDGQLKLVSILPDPDGAGSLEGKAAPTGATLGSDGSRIGSNAISRDGSRIFFGTPDGRLYVRKDATSTVEVSASQKAVPDAQLPASFWTATPNGRYVFFTTEEQLLDSDTDSVSSLYRFDVDTGALIRIGADYAIAVAGASDDGEYVYFSAVTGTGNYPVQLWVWHDGQTKLVANAYAGGWEEETSLKLGKVEVSADGTSIAFGTAAAQPTAAEPQPEQPSQVYLYNAPSDTLRCASCRPDGKAPSAPAVLPIASRKVRSRSGNLAVTPHWLSSDGSRVFFSSPDPLVSTDTNELLDVYEYVDGKARLLSTGLGKAPAYFMNATANGDSAFFTTQEQLVRGDGDENYDVYAARIGGGFHEPPPQVPCTGEACKSGSTTPPQESSAGSAQFSGPGNANQRAEQKAKKKKHKKKARNKKKKRAHKSKPAASKRSVGK